MNDFDSQINLQMTKEQPSDVSDSDITALISKYKENPDYDNKPKIDLDDLLADIENEFAEIDDLLKDVVDKN